MSPESEPVFRFLRARGDPPYWLRAARPGEIEAHLRMLRVAEALAKAWAKVEERKRK